MLNEIRKSIFTVSASSLLLLAGCSGSSPDTSSQSTAGMDTGFVSLGVSDSPLHDAEKVCISFEAVEFKPSGDESFTIELDPPETIDLLDFQGASAAPLLEREEVAAGPYDWVRLSVDARRGSNGGIGDTGSDACDGEASYIVMDTGGVYNLFVPGGDQTGLQLVSGFVVPVNGVVDVTAEWELARSITVPPGLSPDVILKPTIRLVDNAETGSLSGEVSSELASGVDCEPAVHVFDDDVMPNAIEVDVEDPEDPVATAMVSPQMNPDGTTSYRYEVGFLLAGDYEVAFTCDGQAFEPESGKPAAIDARENTMVDFP